MSLDKIHLRKALLLLYLPQNQRISCLRDMIRQDIKKEDGTGGDGGGDFHTPFWADVKDFVGGKSDLHLTTQQRIDANPAHKKRLYPQLLSGFLGWWHEKRRWKNEPYEFIKLKLPSQLNVPEVGSILKIENLLTFKVGDSLKLIYPYFGEEPELTDEAARVGLWALNECLGVPTDSLRILDVLRSRSISAADVEFQGNEKQIFVAKYKKLRELYDTLRKDY